MFNTTIIKSSETKYVPYEKTVIEKRAPTDQSVAILYEMQEKCQKAILDSVEIKDNGLEGVAVIRKNPLKLKFEIAYRFTLNGIEYTGSVETNCISFSKNDNEALRSLFKAMAIDISEKIVITLMPDAINDFRNNMGG
jgi:hypothetical protein